MVVALGLVVFAFLVLLTFGAVTGRVKLDSCCAVADPRRDARMRDAFTAEVPAAPLAPAPDTRYPASRSPSRFYSTR